MLVKSHIELHQKMIHELAKTKTNIPPNPARLQTPQMLTLPKHGNPTHPPMPCERLMDNNRPETLCRIGSVSASVFVRDLENDEGKRTMRSLSVQKGYLDGDEPKYTASLNLAELPQAIRALQLAQEYVESIEAELQFA